MSDSDERCCGADVCIIDDTGRCWCGQVWDVEKMVMPKEATTEEPSELNQSNKNAVNRE